MVLLSGGGFVQVLSWHTTLTLRPTTSIQLWFGIHRGICPLIGGTRMMVIQMLIVIGLRARNNFPLPQKRFSLVWQCLLNRCSWHRFCA